jgi:hypothetical protein
VETYAISLAATCWVAEGSAPSASRAFAFAFASGREGEGEEEGVAFHARALMESTAPNALSYERSSFFASHSFSCAPPHFIPVHCSSL